MKPKGSNQREAKLLVVDDDNAVRESLRRLLEAEHYDGYTVVMRENNAEVLGKSPSTMVKGFQRMTTHGEGERNQ